MTTGSKDHNPTTTKITSRVARKRVQQERGIEIRDRRVEQGGRRAAGCQQHRDHDGKEQGAEERVAAARAQKRGGEDHAHRGEADGSQQKQQAQPKRVRPEGSGKQRPEQRQQQQFHQQHDGRRGCQLARIDGRTRNRGQQKRTDGLVLAFAVEGARQGHRARNNTATHRMPAIASGPTVTSWPEMKAKENTNTTSAAMKPMV